MLSCVSSHCGSPLKIFDPPDVATVKMQLAEIGKLDPRACKKGELHVRAADHW
jgi:hypothetical protein